MSDDEDSDKEVEPEEERDRVAHEIFDEDDTEEDHREKSPRPAAAEEEGGEFGNIDDSGEESGVYIFSFCLVLCICGYLQNIGLWVAMIIQCIFWYKSYFDHGNLCDCSK